ncbi:MAG TPA: four helix bundle protein [Pyrinomonadaceae bacterium]|jgi:four helix bundle protein|nr:four helix bundle protein [Pyrinomonadaceae bacterium]
MSTIDRFEDLEAWKLARVLTGLVYSSSALGNFGRDFALRDQIRRASISIVSNIAEGFERDGDKEFVQFLSMAKGSCGEVRAQLCLAFDQKYISETVFQDLTTKAIQLSRVISGLIRYLRQSQLSGKKYKTAGS